MKINKLTLPLLLIASLFTYQLDDSAKAQTAEPTPDGRPPDAFTSTETCNCSCPDGVTYECLLNRPSDTRTCTQACTDEAPMNCTSVQTSASPEGM